ncbi:ComEC/Rec2 family competence protein [Methanosphaerula palustris]|uniref:Hydrolase (Metallo-beta-lactamase superfamily)-like protein n=1 Tax=Methanosphaerula palustris (strain ATCC BAA-1556 / DSM 19958 / E1-9c) TaxID=521011 RepID=B8GE69_METPE|nr:MBL fold metallo-hydrolase [Methanosphaerula palustris]ACL17570.1 hydrolase (metallo-beta-lactamase superfamily)-like protein [Methanosphaerula palustris E1-9c]
MDMKLNLLIVACFAVVLFALFGGFSYFFPKVNPITIPPISVQPHEVMPNTSPRIVTQEVPTPEPAETTEIAPSVPEEGLLIVHFIDVGEGDAALIISPYGHTMLIDAGPKETSETVVNYLKAQKVTSLDMLVATNGQADHTGGMETVIRTLQPKQFLDNGGPNGHPLDYQRILDLLQAQQVPVSHLAAGDTIDLDPSLSITVLNPGAARTGNQQEDSLVFKLVYKETSFLCCGDMGTATEQRLLASGTDLKSSVLKVAGHGDGKMTSGDFLARVSPDIGVISVGENIYGFPSSRITGTLTMRNAKVGRTDWDGNVIVTSDGKTCSLWQEYTSGDPLYRSSDE